MEQTTYDVFISYSRNDYVQNSKIIPDNPISAIIELFDKNDISYWIDKDGIFVGEEFVKEISKAIVNSKMLVFVSSKNSNESEYTCGEILKAKKAKKLIIPFNIDRCEYNENFDVLLLPLQHIDYVEQPDMALSNLLSTVNREKKRIEKIETDAEKQRIIELARNEIKEKVKEYNALVGQQEDILKDLYAKNKIIGNIKKQCPVCENEVLIKSSFCEKCGWQFPSLYSLDGRKTPICDESQLSLARAHWHNLSSVAQLQNENQKFQKEKTISEETNFTIRLSKAAKEFNMDVSIIREFLTQKGFQVDSSPNAKLTAEMYDLIVKEYQGERGVKNEDMRFAKERYNSEENRPYEEANAKERVFAVGGASFKMIRVEGGSIGTYYIGETQVTQALWQAVMGNNPSGFEGQDHPVERVSWYDICGKDGKGTDPNCFLCKLNQKTGKDFRLPTEAEWEYAAKGGSKSKNYTYAGSDDINKVAWYDGNSMKSTHPVKQLSSNELGLYDMSGNVWEWCEDVYDLSGSGRVLRGGGWYYFARDCWVYSRGSRHPGLRLNRIGFRLVLPQ